MGYLLDQYIDVLGALRAVFDGDGAPSSGFETSNAQSAAAQIARVLREGDELDFDLAMTTIPLGANGTNATYWIHPDHIVEAQVLLLQQMRLYAASSKHSSTNQSGNATPARRKSSSANTERCFDKEDDVALLVLDHAEAFAFKQNASTIGSSEASKTIIRAAANVRCVLSGKAAVVVCTDAQCQQPQSTCMVKKAKIETRTLKDFLDTSTAENGSYKLSTQQNDKPAKCNDTDIAEVRRWMVEHKEAKPIAGVGSKRTRFIGLHNNSAGGIWATLDRDIYMKDTLEKDLVYDDWPSAARSKAIQFPHAILEVRREGAQATALVQALDRSHLVSLLHARS